VFVYPPPGVVRSVFLKIASHYKFTESVITTVPALHYKKLNQGGTVTGVLFDRLSECLQ
jgi:hypothetical protein